MSGDDWISVKERLPNSWERVLVAEGEWVGIGALRVQAGESWFVDDDGLSLEVITHWHPLPPPPAQVKP